MQKHYTLRSTNVYI